LPVRVPTAAGAAVVKQQQAGEQAEPVSYPALDADPLLVPAEGRDGALPGGAAPIEPVATPHTAQPETVTSEAAGPVAEVTPAQSLRAAGYQILEEIGRGGMGIVYRANQFRLNRIVALKMMLAGALAGKEELARFHAEAGAAAGLQHLNIVQIYEVGERKGHPFFSMEFLPGGSLAQHLRGTPRSPRAAAELVATLAQAIHYAHQHGIIHRDLKPANVLLAEDGTAKITDFGLAKRLDSTDGRTQTGAILGTPSYMSPEQAAGHAHLVGPGSDVYALGAMLYELVTGRPPFKGPSHVETIFQVIHEEPVAPRQLQARLPRDLETICLKCLDKDPRRRYGSARALAEDLHNFLMDEPIRAQPTRTWERGWKWAKRRPAVAALLAVSGVAVLALAVACVAFVYNARLQEALRAAESARHDTETAHQEGEVLRQRTLAALRNSLYFNKVALARREWLSDHAERADQLLEECPADARQWEWAYLKRLCHAELLSLPAHQDGVADVVYSRDGQLLASAGYDNCIRIWDASSGRPVARMTGHTSWVRAVCFSPDGKLVASAGDDGTMRIWEVAGAKERFQLTGHKGPVAAIAYSPTEPRLASAGADGVVRIWAVDSGRQLFELNEHSPGITSVAFHPDGRRLAAAGSDRTVHVWDLASRKILFTIHGHTKEISRVLFSPDGKRLASASRDQTVRIWNSADGAEISTLSGHTGPVLGLAFSADSRRLASSGVAIRVWDTETGDELFPIRGHTKPIFALAFSPNGAHLASGSEDGTVRIWDAQTHPEHRQLSGMTREIAGVAFSPDGRMLAATDGDVKVWETASGRLLYPLPRQPDPVTRVTFSPDGRHLVTAAGWTVKFWNAASGKELKTFDQNSSEPVFSPDGNRLATVGWETNEAKEHRATVLVWDVQTGKKLYTLRGHGEHLFCLAFSPDGQLLASAGDDHQIKLWDVATGQEVRAIPVATQDIFTVSFSPDGKRIAAAGGQFGRDLTAVKIWEVSTGQEALTIKGHSADEWFHGVVFAPAGERIASLGIDGKVTIWDTTAGAEVLTLSGHTDWVLHAAFSRDGAYLATGGRDHRVILWNGTSLAATRGR